tara:strand:- start:1852 stop:2142 length:291 start_codon:yes stop_codon:yes gene_type:complete
MKMEENNESLKIVKKRWNWLRKNIGQNIIDFFQMKDQKREAESEIEDDDQIELLLLEANAYGLRIEVEQWAIQLLKEDTNLSRIEAYVRAYNEWIK